MRKIVLTSIVFLIIGVILILIYHFLFSSYYIKGVYLLPSSKQVSISIPYSSFIFEYKDNSTLPLKITFNNLIITKYNESNLIFYYYGESFNGNIMVENNYSYPVLMGYVVIDETPFFIFLPTLFYTGIILIILAVIIIILSFVLK
ncbi:hypothetical protein EWF20_05700 [Sulfolobus sp. S-194]|uniref:hypothetical protein n=1 Tax=Sulfolobus sp. S-194 TaxID=2512240 RepID=UPI00143723DD|nr:hypothetical protein [Sulfolobus sp. S-194]QIW23702.1 hypothetical protein EWF20_05700 [Sulfolobus sp. S-194]